MLQQPDGPLAGSWGQRPVLLHAAARRTRDALHLPLKSRRAHMRAALPFLSSSLTARLSAPIRDPSTPASEKIAEAGSLGYRLSRLKALGRDDNREAVHVICD